MAEKTIGQERSPAVRSFQVIANPGAGKAEPMLAILNQVFHGQDVDWQVSVTHDAGDAERFAKKFAEDPDIEVVAAYGGDGTVNEVASALAGTGKPMAILPGGTANVMASELGIPDDLGKAALLLAGPHWLRAIDLGEIACDDGTTRRFALRVAVGLEAEMTVGATPELKERLGDMAYVVTALRELKETPMADYTLVVDGERIEAKGITAMIANSGAIPRGDLTLSPDILVDDGKLDVVVLRQADLASVAAVTVAVVTGQEPPEEPLQRWQGREVRLEAEPEVRVVADGELFGTTPFSARVLPGAVTVLVPPGTTGEGTEKKPAEPAG